MISRPLLGRPLSVCVCPQRHESSLSANAASPWNLRPSVSLRVQCTCEDGFVSQKSDATLNEIEQTQLMLRESIAATKKLADESDSLIQRHRRELSEET